MARKFWVRTTRNVEISAAIKDIDRYGLRISQRIRQEIKHSTDAVREDAARRVSVRTGKLKSMILSRMAPSGNAGFVSANMPYAHLVEFGAGPAFVVPKKAKALKVGTAFLSHALIPARKAKPFLRPAAENEKPRLAKRIKEIFDAEKS